MKSNTFSSVLTATSRSTKASHRQKSRRSGHSFTKVRIWTLNSKSYTNDFIVGLTTILRSEAAKLPNKTAILPHDQDRRYMMELDVFHQLHCLVSRVNSLSPTIIFIDVAEAHDTQRVVLTVSILRRPR
jgi:hypothetical protein